MVMRYTTEELKRQKQKIKFYRTLDKLEDKFYKDALKLYKRYDKIITFEDGDYTITVNIGRRPKKEKSKAWDRETI